MIIIVSGLPRSGTSLMMQMLHAGGLPMLIDSHRPADLDNPRGYWEYEPVKRLHKDNAWMPTAEGKVVKIVSALLQYLPPQHTYNILFMQRPLQEVLASQQVMLQRRGEERGTVDDTMLGTVFGRHLEQTERWLAAQRHMTVLPVQYHETLAKPLETATRVAEFLGLLLAVEDMARTVEPDLHRQKLCSTGEESALHPVPRHRRRRL